MASIGSSIDEVIVKQIEARQNRFGNRTRSKATSEYLNSNSAFVKLRSSVNEIEIEDFEAIEKGKVAPKGKTGIDTKARNVILTGGTLNNSGKPKAGIDITPDRNSVSTSAAYHNSNTLGFRPMPGITSINVKNKGQGGTLRDADVTFTVWSVEDLNDFELCYFRVGYSALLEFGHTVYVDNNGEVQTITESQLISNDTWFANGNGQAIEENIAAIKKNTFGNYDAVFGFIKNFSWKLRNDGGFDCSVSIVSKGVIINALKEGKTTDHVSVQDQSVEESEKGKNEGRSIFHFIFYRIERQRKEPNFKMVETLRKKKGESIASKLNEAELFRTDMTVGSFTNSLLKFLNESINLVYMPFGTFLELVNAFCMLKDQDGKNIAEFDPGSEETFRTFNEHFSIDPLVAVPPKKPTGKYSYAHISKDGLHDSMEAYAGNNTNYIRNIMVSTHFLRSVVESYTDGPVEEGAGLLDLVNDVIKGIQHALGDVNDFRVIWNEVEPGFWYYVVVDGKMPSLIEKKKDLETIKISGLSNTVTDISISSKIGPELASMVSIAAQGTTGNYKENLNNILRFNAGAVDRHYITKMQNSDDAASTAEDLEAKKEEFDNNHKKVWANFNDVGTFDPELFLEIKTESISVLTSNTKKDLSSKGIPDPMPVPVELSITMKGIAGLKQLSAFKIDSNLIPSKYKNVAYIINGVDNEIGTDNQWKTTLSANMYSV